MSEVAEDLLAQALNGVPPTARLAEIRAEAWRRAEEGTRAELQALQALRDTIQGRLDAARATLQEIRAQADGILQKLLHAPELADPASFSPHLAALEAQAQTLEELIKRLEASLADCTRRIEAAERARWEVYAQEYEAQAWPLLEDALQRMGTACADFLTWALETVGETRDTGEGHRLIRYLIARMWACVLPHTKAPAVISFARAQLTTDAPLRPDWLVTLLRSDFPQRVAQPLAGEMLQDMS